MIPLTERVEGGARNITVEGAANWTHTLKELSPGATYQLHAFTLLHDKESAAYASRNFTTSEYCKLTIEVSNKDNEKVLAARRQIPITTLSETGASDHLVTVLTMFS